MSWVIIRTLLCGAMAALATACFGLGIAAGEPLLLHLMVAPLVIGMWLTLAAWSAKDGGLW